MIFKQIIASTIVWSVLLAASALYGQTPGAGTLGDLWPKVKENYVGVGVRTSAVEAATLRARAVKSNRLPRLTAQAQNTYGTHETSAGAFFPQEGFFNVSGGATSGSVLSANTFASATVAWELFSFGKLRKQSDAAETLMDKAVSEKSAYLLELKKTLSERYIALLYHDAKFQWAGRNAARLQDIRNITSGLAAAGLRPAADSLLASASYVQARGEQDKWDGLKTAARIRLAELYADGDSIDLTLSSARFEDPVEVALPSPQRLDPAHPVLNAIRQEARYYSLSGAAQKSASLPSLRLLGGYAYRGTGISPAGTASGEWQDGFGHATNNFIAGVGITWNLTGLHTNRLQASALTQEADRARLLARQYEQAMEAGLAAAQAKIIRQYDQLEQTSLAVHQSQNAFDMYLARYKSGLIALSELLQIRTLLEQAENAHIEAARDYWMLLADEATLTADFDFLFHNL